MYAHENSTGQWDRLPSPDHVDVAVTAFSMLSDPTRMRLLWLLCGGEFDVASLAGLVDAARPAVSQHLAKLRLAGLVTHRREGRRVLYQARGGHVGRLLAEAANAADHHLHGLPDHD
ncbi:MULTISPECIES: ArsR/SmtB family transcription factor [Actinoalloteichus]|uniref:DNA binding protein with helix-turn-helix domain n=1 Tax=Actinoalloteichus fjordicus TaxID=1612552 RepID=A0AAC9PTK7_9PSEU|nr:MULTISPECIES: metalloregulator ArsR/SmtB family transcription factor [Actinoalloteichus]APU15981.1 DNA binding protein with helix-turn-helix domain [Actinoalloteichus fjordicus]APU22045.1 DNA binding protein with helix-turn-helix domain [Actinoalloteichus sp. GBA129-24]